MFLNGYPYTDFHEMNLDFLLKSMETLKQAFASFTASNSLIFAEPLLHNITSTYAKNTIVLDPDGNAYISLQNVPSGVQLSNADYWLMVFNFEEYTEKANKNFTNNYFRDMTRAPYALSVGDWVVLNDVLYTVIQAIAADDLLVPGTNLTHFTVEQFLKDFVSSVNQTLTNWYNQMTGTINQYKNDIDASELAYRNQLAQDIATTTANLQTQLNQAISGVTVDSEVINARVGFADDTYSTLRNAIVGQFGEVLNMMKDSIDSQCSISMIANSSISAAGQLVVSTTNTWFAYVKGESSVIVTGGSLYGFFDHVPAIGDYSIDGTRYDTGSNMANYSITIPAGCTILAIRNATEPMVISTSGRLTILTYSDEYTGDFNDAIINSLGTRTTGGTTVATNNVPYDGFVGNILTLGIRGTNYFKTQIACSTGPSVNQRMWLRGYYTSWSAWHRIPDEAMLDDSVLTMKGALLNILGCFSNITCCGDSLTKGQVYTGAGISRAAYKPYPKVLEGLTGVPVVTYAQGGYTAANWWNAWSSDIVSKENQLAIIYLGTNGGLTDTLSTDAPVSDPYTDWANTNTGCYAKMIAKFKDVGAKVLLVKVYDGSDVPTTNSVIEQCATRFGCGLIDNDRFTDNKYHYYPDLSGTNSTHYNDLGYAAFANYLCAQVASMDTNFMKYLIPD